MNSLEIGERFRLRRKELRLSQEEIAKKMGYAHKSSISYIEQGKHPIDIDNIDRLAEAVNVNAAWLLGIGEKEELHSTKRTFCANLRAYRKLNGLTLKEMADKLTITFSTYQKYETGNIECVDIEKVEEFARALNIKPSILVGWEDK